MPALTKQEYKELVELIDIIEKVECFGTRDLRRRTALEGKATDAQLKRAYAKCGLDAAQFIDVD